MKNIDMAASGPDADKNRLVIVIDLSQSFGKSSTGKTIIVASTEGNAKVVDRDGNAVYVGVNVFKYPPRGSL